MNGDPSMGMAQSGGGGGGGASSKKRPASAMTAASGVAVKTEGGTVAGSPSNFVLNTAKLTSSIWLVKIPASVAKALEDAPVGSKIGTLNISMPAPSGPAMGPPTPQQRIEQVELVPGLKGAEELPLDYSLTEPPLGSALPRLYGFSRDPTTGQVALEGSVVRQLTLQPKQDSMQYRLFKKFRQVEANKKPHTLKLVSLTDVRLTQEKKELDQSSSKDIDLGAPLPKPSGNYVPRPPPTNTGGGGGEGARKKQKLDPESLRAEVLRLFEQRPFWSLKELLQQLPTGQTEGSLKTALQRVADYQSGAAGRGGPEARGKYMLKEMYATQPPKTET